MNLKGIGLFMMCIISLISEGKKESIEEIEKHIDESDLIEYIYNKYKSSMSIDFDDKIYNNESLNKYFHEFSGFIYGNERRKFGIMNDDDGLLLILSLISDIVERKSIYF